MSGNQYHFEIVRDIVEIIGKLKEGDSVAISITRHKEDNTSLFDWHSSRGDNYGSSEVSRALRKTYSDITGRYK